MGVWSIIVIALWVLWLIVRLATSATAVAAWRTLAAWWQRESIPARALTILFVCLLTTYAATKGTGQITSVLKILFWDHPMTWPLTTAQLHIEAAGAANNITAQELDVIEGITNDVCTISFDWHAPDRLPYHERQNVLAWTAQVVPTNIAGILYEDHYVTFNYQASTNPAVILIEYAGRNESGEIIRYSSSVVTNSYPDTHVVNLQSGAHTCYWFRCAVPVPFLNSVRDWNGEALFGSPEGSGKGFDLLGTLVIDDGDNVWVGATTNHVLGGITNEFINGINVTEAEE